MLQSIREGAQGWIAWFIVILISVPFALWGVQEYIGVGSEPAVASVNDSEITERDFEQNYRQFRQQLRQRMGDSYRPELLDDALLRKEVLESMIQRELVMQATDRMGLRAGDKMVREVIMGIPSFQVNGRFSQDAYERSIRAQGIGSSGFEQQMRQLLVSDQLIRAVNGSELVTGTELEEVVRLRRQSRELEYLVIPVDAYLDSVPLQEGEARDYYEGHLSEFMAPERVLVEYLELDIDRIAETLEKPDEETLLGYYEQHKDDYINPEQRRASHILITVEEGADEALVAGARERAEAALKRVRGEDSFADVAREISQDPGSADMGGDLGFFEMGIMDKAFEKSVFSLVPGKISEPVRTPFGFHLILLQEIRPPAGNSFEEVREEILSTYRKNEAERFFYEYAERLNDLAYEDPDSLEPAADALGLQTQLSDWMGREGGEGILSNSKVVGAAFSEDVLVERHNSEVLELSAEHIIVLRVSEHEESSMRPFDTVSDGIILTLKMRKASEEARRQGEAIQVRLNGGESLEQIATGEGRERKQVGLVSRDNREIPLEIVTSLFRLPRPAEGATVFGKAHLKNGDFAVIALHRVVDSKLADMTEEEQKQLHASLQRSNGQSYYRHLVQNLRESAEVITKRQD